MKRLLFLLTIISNLLPLATGAQATLQEDLPLSYLVQQPAVPAAKMPVIILMHGYGSNEADLFALKEQLPHYFLIVSVRAPIAMGSNAFQWFRMEEQNGSMQGNRKDLDNSATKIKAFIPALVKKYKADADRVYLCGFSQGAMMCYEAGLTAPQLVKGIAPLSGKIFDSLKPQIRSSATLKQLSIFIGHGDADTRVAYSFATEAQHYLKGLGLSPVLHTYRGLQHNINATELNDLVQWLSGK